MTAALGGRRRIHSNRLCSRTDPEADMAATRLLGVAGLFLVGGTAIATSRWHTLQSPVNWRVQFTQAALQIPFDVDRGPELDDGVPPDVHLNGIPKMTIAPALKRDTAKAGRVEFRITSAGAYPRLGIAPGLNYVWKDVFDGTTRLLVIPADTSYGAKWLKVESHQHKSPPKAPRLLISRDSTTGAQSDRSADAKGVDALDAKASVFICGSCGFPPHWCGSGDTTMRLISPPSLLESAFKQYFARNKVQRPRR